jgi:hypothetical protein
MKIAHTGTTMVFAAVALAGCSNTPKQAPAADTNVFPANYKDQLATYLSTVLTDRADFRNSLIGTPVLKQIGDSQHYVVCVQLNGHNQHKDKVVIYLATTINQYVDATPEQCADAAYQPCCCRRRKTLDPSRSERHECQRRAAECAKHHDQPRRRLPHEEQQERGDA